MKTLFTLFLILSIRDVNACTCKSLTLNDQYNFASVIFYGKHIKSTGKYDVFEVSQFFKVPDLNAFPHVEIRDEKYIISVLSNETSCGLSFDSLSSYLAYCYTDGGGKLLATNACTGTRKIINNNFLMNIDGLILDEALEIEKTARLDSLRQLHQSDSIRISTLSKEKTKYLNEIKQIQACQKLSLTALIVSVIMLIILGFLLIKSHSKKTF